jgi:hypothetical protein
MPLSHSTAHTGGSGSGGGGTTSQFGSCAQGSMLSLHAVMIRIGGPSDVGVPDDCDGGDSGCCTDSCGGCATCAGQGESQVPSLDNPYAYWLNHAGPVKINPSIGNAVLRLATPNTGPFDPGPCLAYNSKSTNSDNFGYGWGSRSRRWGQKRGRSSLFNPSTSFLLSWTTSGT